MEHGHRQFPLGNSGLWWAPSVLPEPTRISPKVSVSKTHSTIPVEELQEVATDTNPPRTNSLTCPHHFKGMACLSTTTLEGVILVFKGASSSANNKLHKLDMTHDMTQINRTVTCVPFLLGVTMAPPGKFEVEVVMTWDPPGVVTSRCKKNWFERYQSYCNSVMIHVTWINSIKYCIKYKVIPIFPSCSA